MSYITSKTDWKGGDIPLPSDFNRMENNIETNNDSIIAIEAEIDDLKDGTTSLGGVKTFTDGIKVDTIDSISGNGVTVDGVTIKAGAVIGEIFYGQVWGA
jgi:hypothetical protein